MKLLMDSDCLIKLTKTKLKELVCKSFDIIIPNIVKKEVIDDAEGYPDRDIIKENLEKKLLKLDKTHIDAKKGDEAVFEIFKKSKFEAICTDDKRFIKKLKFFDFTYITPTVFIILLLKNSKLTIKDAFSKLELLSPLVSDDEYSTIKLILENWRPL